jgi:hypothetical protein
MRRADRQVRETVERFGGCLDVLTTREERVLRLRAGVGPAEPASRVRVADRLNLSVRQVRRVERRGVRALERAGRRGCAAAAPTAIEEQAFTMGGALGAVLGGAALPGAEDPPAPAAGEPAGDRAGGGGGAAGHATDGGAGSGRAAGRDGKAGGVKGVAATSLPADGGPSGLTVLVILLVLATVIGAGFEARRMWQSDPDAAS